MQVQVTAKDKFALHRLILRNIFSNIKENELNLDGYNLFSKNISKNG